jgi:hypothetical protein
MSFYKDKDEIVTTILAVIFTLICFGFFCLMVNAELNEVKKRNVEKTKYERVENIQVVDINGDTLIISGKIYKKTE